MKIMCKFDGVIKWLYINRGDAVQDCLIIESDTDLDEVTTKSISAAVLTGFVYTHPNIDLAEKKICMCGAFGVMITNDCAVYYFDTEKSLLYKVSNSETLHSKILLGVNASSKSHYSTERMLRTLYKVMPKIIESKKQTESNQG